MSGAWKEKWKLQSEAKGTLPGTSQHGWVRRVCEQRGGGEGEGLEYGDQHQECGYKEKGRERGEQGRMWLRSQRREKEQFCAQEDRLGGTAWGTDPTSS